jgi:histidinol dehydrogenase
MNSSYYSWPADRDADAVRRRLLTGDGGIPANIAADARAIIAAVRERGDEALLEFTQKFDGVQLQASELRVSQTTIDASADKAPRALRDAIDLAVSNIRRFHLAQRPNDLSQMAEGGTRLSLQWNPVASAGLYVPGGRAAYPSTVLMNAIPAQAAGVERLAVFTVPGTVEENPAVAYALQTLGLTEVYRVAGAQAIAAAALGTASIPAVDVITGPGNAWVAAAKRELIGTVGIDSIAGPSEVLVLCDESANPDWIALDLLAQAEHDPMARVVVACTHEPTLRSILDALNREIETSPRASIAGPAWRDHGLALLVDEAAGLVEICQAMAPEHLQVITEPELPLRKLVAGAIFVGNDTPTAAGDYIAGSNHVLPTGGACRFSSPLGTLTFMRATTVVRATSKTMSVWGPAGAVLADYEGLNAHAAALRARAGGAQ